MVPMDDAATAALVNAPSLPALTLLPPPAAYARLTDKETVLAAAKEAGLATPRVFGDTTPEGVLEACKQTGGHLLAKPRRGSGGRGIRPIGRSDDLPPGGDMVLVERIPQGRKFDVGLLFGPDGTPRASFVQEELRWFPGETDASTVQQSVRRPDLVDAATRLLTSVGWRGPAEVEFMEVDGVAWLMEVNTRYWASLALAIACGVDFPHLNVELARGKDVRGPDAYKVGLRCVWRLPADLLHALRHPLRQAASASRLAPAAAGSFDDTICLEDPLPTLGFAVAALRYAFDPAMWRFFFRWDD